MRPLRVRSLLGQRPRLLAAAVAGAVAVSLVLVSIALAHYGSLFSRRYPAVDPSLYTVNFYFDSQVPGGRTRSRIIDGSKPWTKLGRKVVFVAHRRGIRGKGSKTCQTASGGRPKGVSYWETVDGAGTSRGDVLGFNRYCVWPRTHPNAGRLAGFVQVYDSKQPNWYRKTGRVPADKNDLQSVATHEFGHAAGWGPKHYKSLENTSTCAKDNLGRETMCAFTYRGQSRTRTLGTLDKHVTRHVYGPR